MSAQTEALKLAATKAKEWIAKNAFDKESMEVFVELAKALAEQPAQQEPVAFYIYKTTPPHGNLAAALVDGVLPWVYDQDPSSGFVARMLVTPYTPQPPAQPLTYCQECMRPNPVDETACAHGITKGNT